MKMMQAEWSPVDGKELEPNALNAIRDEGCVAVTAGPGAGKTEMLAQKTCFLLETGTCPRPKRILAVSFKRDAAAELEKRVNNRCGQLSRERFSSLTFDAFAKSILDRFRMALPVEMRPSGDYSLGGPEEDMLVEKLAQKYGYFTRCRNRRNALDEFEKDVVASIESETRDGALDDLLKGGADQKSHLTYRMVFALAVLILAHNPMIVRAIRLTYTHVFLDEFQDITEPQYQLVKLLFLGSASVTAVGDDKQRIMVWAGAMKDSFARFEKDFGAKHIELYMNYRSAPRLVRLQQLMYESLGQKSDSAIASDAWKEDDGEIRLVGCLADSSESIWLANEIEELLQSGVPAEEACVLCKQKVGDYTCSLVKELDKRQIHSRDESARDVIAISNDHFLGFLLSFAWIALGANDNDCWQEVRSTLSRLLGFFDDEGFSEYSRYEAQIEERRIALGRRLSAAKNACDIKGALSEICTEWIGVENIAAVNTLYTAGVLDERLELLGDALFKRMSRWGSIKDGVEILLAKNVVRLMTIHKSKGMEFEYVYLVGLENDAFWSMQNDPEEGRKAFFVALSRAKKSITFTCCRYREALGCKQQRFEYVNEFFRMLTESGLVTIVNDVGKAPSTNDSNGPLGR